MNIKIECFLKETMTLLWKDEGYHFLPQQIQQMGQKRYLQQNLATSQIHT